MPRSINTSARVQLRVFQQARENTPTAGFTDDLEFLQSKDLDMSVRLGALLAFDALLMTAVINPISASPGAPLSLDAPGQPVFVAIICLSVVLLAVAAMACVRGVLIGEEFDLKGVENKRDIAVQRLLAAYCSSIDAQARMIRLSSQFTIVGGAVGLIGCAAIMAAKIWG